MLLPFEAPAAVLVEPKWDLPLPLPPLCLLGQRPTPVHGMLCLFCFYLVVSNAVV